MSVDLSSLNSITSLLGSTYGTTTATSATNTSSTSFENYLMNALGTNSTSATSSVSSLLDMYSNGGTNALLSGLTSNDSTTGIASQLLAGLQSSGTSASSVTGLYNTASSVTTTDAYADGLISNFQSQILSNMNAAKAKLQTSYEGYAERMGENPTAAAKSRIDQMQQNISVIENYIASKSTNSYDSLLGQLTGTDSAGTATNTTSTSNSLVDQLNTKSALTQYMLNL